MNTRQASRNLTQHKLNEILPQGAHPAVPAIALATAGSDFCVAKIVSNDQNIKQKFMVTILPFAYPSFDTTLS
jgi:hypothetical protein